VRARDLLPNPKNWRRHPKVQANALRGLLNEIGIADALLARELPDGRLQLIDGHLRAATMPDEEVPERSTRARLTMLTKVDGVTTKSARVGAMRPLHRHRREPWSSYARSRSSCSMAW
jgi:hypothetical protein